MIHRNRSDKSWLGRHIWDSVRQSSRDGGTLQTQPRTMSMAAAQHPSLTIHPRSGYEDEIRRRFCIQISYSLLPNNACHHRSAVSDADFKFRPDLPFRYIVLG